MAQRTSCLLCNGAERRSFFFPRTGRPWNVQGQLRVRAVPRRGGGSLFAQERGLSDRRLRGLLADGALERLGHGLYRKANAPPADLDRIEIALRASDATLCLTTA